MNVARGDDRSSRRDGGASDREERVQRCITYILVDNARAWAIRSYDLRDKRDTIDRDRFSLVAFARVARAKNHREGGDEKEIADGISSVYIRTRSNSRAFALDRRENFVRPGALTRVRGRGWLGGLV